MQLQLDSITVRSFADIRSLDSVISGRLLEAYSARNDKPIWFDSLSSVKLLDEFRRILHDYADEVSDSTFAPMKIIEKINLVQDTTFIPVKNKPVVYESELEFSYAFLLMVEKMYYGNKQLDTVLTFRNKERKGINSAELLNRFVKADGKNFENLIPVHPQFFSLVKGVREYEKCIKENTICQLSDSLPLIKGMENKEVLTLKKRLQVEGYYESSDTTGLFDESLEKAVYKTKKILGLTPNSTVDRKFCEALNAKSKRRLKIAKLNVERARRLPYVPNGTCLLINIPAYQLYVFENNIRTWKMNVIVGKTDTPTELFADSIRYIVFNPYWNIPKSIVLEEILPKIMEDSTYLDKRGMSVVRKNKEGIPTIVQKPGAGNSLGKIKFMFPNAHSIYLHDTPSKSLFSRSKRAISHGCVRVNEPKKLALYLLKNQPEWDEEKIDKQLANNKEKTVTLKKPVPIHFEYLTAWANEKGEIEFFDDIYKYD